MNWWFILIVVFLPFASSSQSTNQLINTDSLQEKYICPPCGCRGDHHIHQSPGMCDHCSMNLIPVKEGPIGHLQIHISHLFRYGQHYSNYYLRIFYPIILLFLLIPFLTINKKRWGNEMTFSGLVILSLALYMLKFQIYGANYSVSGMRWGATLPLSFLLICWPALYLFLLSITNGKISKPMIVAHFSPALVLFLGHISIFYQSLSGAETLYNEFDTILIPIEQLLFVTSGFFYGFLIKKQAIRMRFKKHDIRRQSFKISIIAAFLISAIMALMLAANFLLFQGSVATLDYHLLWLVLITFLTGWVFHMNKGRDTFFPKKKNSYQMGKDQLRQLKTKFDELLTNEKIITSSGFDLSKAAQLVGIRPRLMTEFLRLAYHKNFYEIVNQARAEMAKQKLLSRDYDHLTNEAIGSLCGFSSKTTFFKSFKTLTGTTPGLFKKNLSEKNKQLG